MHIKIILFCIAISDSSIHGSKPAPLTKENYVPVHTKTPAAFKKLKKKQLCQIDAKKAAIQPSKQYRQLAFEALKNCNHPKPQEVVLTNDPNYEHHACAYFYNFDDTDIQAINFNEKGCFSTCSFGTQRIIMHHEAAHVILKHSAIDAQDPEYYLKKQREERQADRLGIHAACCKQCTLDYCQWYLEKHQKEDCQKKQFKKFNSLTLANLGKMSVQKTLHLIEQTSSLSAQQKATHPYNIERALRAYKVTHTSTKLCAHHQQQAPSSN